METLLETPMTIPISQISLALLSCTIFLIYGRVRFALFTAYCFVLYWAKPWTLSLYTDTTPRALNAPVCLFIAFCLVTAFLAIAGLVFSRD